MSSPQISSVVCWILFHDARSGQTAFAKGYKLFCNGGMDRHDPIKVRFRSIYLDCDRDHLNELSGAFADNVAAEHEACVRRQATSSMKRLLIPARSIRSQRNPHNPERNVMRRLGASLVRSPCDAGATHAEFFGEADHCPWEAAILRPLWPGLLGPALWIPTFCCPAFT